jgi:hypothetical protein
MWGNYSLTEKLSFSQIRLRSVELVYSFPTLSAVPGWYASTRNLLFSFKRSCVAISNIYSGFQTLSYKSIYKWSLFNSFHIHVTSTKYFMLFLLSFFLPWCNSPQWGKAFSLSRIHYHTRLDTPHSVGLSGRVIKPTQRPLPDNTQHSQRTIIHAPGGIRTHNPSKRAATDPLLRPRGHWDRPSLLSIVIK